MTIRNQMCAEDVGAIAQFHGDVYGREYGWSDEFTTYVWEPLSRFAARHNPRERIWIAEEAERLIGCIAIAEASPGVAQLRWFLVAPEARGQGLGGRLLDEALAFCRAAQYKRILLWTVSELTQAAKLYKEKGFLLAEAREADLWGACVTEQRYELALLRS